MEVESGNRGSNVRFFIIIRQRPRKKFLKWLEEDLREGETKPEVFAKISNKVVEQE